MPTKKLVQFHPAAPLSSEKTALLAILVNFIVTVIRFFFGYWSGSTALIGDSWHHLKDVAGSASVYTAIKLAKIQNESFPYGLYKIEDLVALAMSILIFGVGYELLEEVILSPTQEVQHVSYTIIAIIICLLIKFFFGRYEYHVAKQTHSPGLRADARHFLADVWGSLVILIGLFGEFINLHLEFFTTLIIVFIIWLNAGKTAIQAISSLMDIALPLKERKEIKEFLLTYTQVKDIMAIYSRKAGSKIFIELDLQLDALLNREAAEKLCHSLEKDLYNKYPQLARATIHYHAF